MVLLCLKVKKTTTYRDLGDELIEMPRIRDALELDLIPAPQSSVRHSTAWKWLSGVSYRTSHSLIYP